MKIGVGELTLNGTTGYAATSTSPIDTSRSFTVSAWATTAGRPTRPMTVMSMAGANANAFAVRYVPDATTPATAGRWQLVTRNADSTTATASTAEHTQFQENDWNHVAVVYDAYAGRIALYVNGQVQGASCLDDTTCSEEQVSWNYSVLPFAAAKGLQLGRLKTGASTWGEYWSGAIDDVWVLQGAAADTQIQSLNSGVDLGTTTGP